MPYTNIIGQFRWIGVPVLVQAVATFAAMTAIESLIGNDLVASLIGAGMGILALLSALHALQPNILAESRAVASALMGSKTRL